MPDAPERSAEWIVVVNHEEQYSVWQLAQPIPAGWQGLDFRGTRDECLDHVAEIWTDMRPLSVRRALGEVTESTS